MTHRASVLGRGYRDSHLDSPRLRFRRAIMLLLMTIVVPGSAQIAVGKKSVGWFAVTVWIGLLSGGAYVLYKFRTERATVIDWFTNSDVLTADRIATVVLAALWLLLILKEWRHG